MARRPLDRPQRHPTCRQLGRATPRDDHQRQSSPHTKSLIQPTDASPHIDALTSEIASGLRTLHDRGEDADYDHDAVFTRADTRALSPLRAPVARVPALKPRQRRSPSAAGSLERGGPRPCRARARAEVGALAQPAAPRHARCRAPATQSPYGCNCPGSGGTSTACSRSASSGTTSSARSCVEASTT